jgi:GTP-binding protein
VALNKADLPDGRDMADIVTAEIAERGWPVFQISALTHHGLKELTFAMAELVAKSRTERVVEQAERIVIRPKPKGSGDEFTITETTDSTTERGRRSWRVRGIKPERWIRQTDFSNDEAVGFLGDRLNRIGVEKQLLERGACEGDDVLIGHPDNSVVFDFKPGMDAGAAEMLGRRGEDQRFTEDRPAAGRRRAIDELLPERGDNETRADVARRLDALDADQSDFASELDPDGPTVVFVNDDFDEVYPGEDG